MHRQSGQASLEYVAVLALVAAALAGAGVLAAAPDLPAAVLARLRVGLCMAAGDVCRDADARARGLDPCVVASEAHAKETGVSIVLVRSAHGHDYAIEHRSDGSVVLRATDGGTLGASHGPALRLGPVHLGGEAGAAVTFRRGREWTFRNAAAARRFLARIPDPFGLTDDGDVGYHGAERAPVRYLEGGGALGAELAAELAGELGGRGGGLALPGLGAQARAVLGRRRSPQGTTLYYDLGAATGGELADRLPRLAGEGRWVAEWLQAQPPVLTLRSSVTHRGRVRERVVRLALGDPGDRRAALRFAVAPLHRVAATLAARDLASRVRARGTVEVRVYEERRKDDRLDATVRLVFSGGFDHATSSVRRRLLSADVTAGGRTVRRVDCVGLARS